jgi:hypothetical protein
MPSATALQGGRACFETRAKALLSMRKIFDGFKKIIILRGCERIDRSGERQAARRLCVFRDAPCGRSSA